MVLRTPSIVMAERRSAPRSVRHRSRVVRTDACREFRANGYYVVASMMRPSEATRLGAKLAASIRRFGVDSDIQVPGSPARYADDIGETLLGRLQPQVERVAGTPLFPTYSYARVYQHGAVLERHTDRPACEISLSLNLSFEGDAPWPLWIEGPHGSTAVTLRPGGGVVYRGIDCPHWREPFQGVECVQVFLHYVAQDGPHASWRGDRRRL